MAGRALRHPCPARRPWWRVAEGGARQRAVLRRLRPASPEAVSDFAAASGVSGWVVAAGEELEREG